MPQKLNESSEPLHFSRDQKYDRQKIHDEYGGNRQRGISPSASFNVIFLFSGPGGREHGYSDGWSEDQKSYQYTGEGTTGDMKWTEGNKAILDHIDNDKELHLFEQQGKQYAYIGQMVYGWHEEVERDSKGSPRRTIVFHLFPIEKLDGMVANQTKTSPVNMPVTSSKVLTNRINRSNQIKSDVLMRARGRCEYCGKNAPFTDRNGEPFLEVHHILQLSDYLFENVKYAIAVCPNCHRHAHYGADSKQVNEKMIEGVSKFYPA